MPIQQRVNGAMAKIAFGTLGAAFILVVSFVLALKVIDYYSLFPPKSIPMVSLTADGKDSLVISAGTYALAYRTSGAKSCEMHYQPDGGSPGQFPMPPNTAGSNPSGLIGVYTLTCIGPEGTTASKSVRITRSAQ
jgi:hypothetical protein